MNLGNYSVIIFDCDGVILDSNHVKTEAFRVAAKPYGEAAAEALVKHHITNGGVSRYVKFAYFLDSIVPQYAESLIPSLREAALEQLLSTYAKTVRLGLMSCAIAEGLAELRAATPNSRWLIVSGGDQTELRDIFEARGISGYFDGGIFGSPETKDSIISREMKAGSIKIPALFLGDSKLDHQVATRHHLDFIFLSGWTELPEWHEYVNQFSLKSASHLANILNR